MVTLAVMVLQLLVAAAASLKRAPSITGAPSCECCGIISSGSVEQEVKLEVIHSVSALGISDTITHFAEQRILRSLIFTGPHLLSNSFEVLK